MKTGTTDDIGEARKQADAGAADSGFPWVILMSTYTSKPRYTYCPKVETPMHDYYYATSVYETTGETKTYDEGYQMGLEDGKAERG